MRPGDISIVPGPTVREKLKSGGDGPGRAAVVLELVELDVAEDVAAALEDLDVELLDVDVELLDVEVVLAAGALCEGLG